MVYSRETVKILEGKSEKRMKKEIGRERLKYLLIVMTVVVLSVISVSLLLFYRSVYDHYVETLSKNTRSLAHFIETVAKFNTKHAVEGDPQKSFNATLSQIREHHKDDHIGVKRITDMSLALLKEGKMEFLLEHTNQQEYKKPPEIIKMGSSLAKPMQMALLGKRGTMVALDNFGIKALTAYQPVDWPGYTVGIVTKIEMGRIYDPFKKAVAGALALGFIFTVAGSMLFVRLSNPLFWELESRNEELKTVIAQADAAQRLLVRTEKLASIGTLSAGVAHEILNPLNIISTMVQVMKLDKLTPDMRENLGIIMKQVKRATKITNNLRMFAHRKKAEITNFDIHELFDKTATLIEHDLSLDNIRIVRDYAKNLPMARGDEDQIAQVFLNLLNNSRDALKGQVKSKITVKTKNLGKDISIIFSDNGHGIPDDIIGKVFDPFFSTKDPGDGTGLGLSLVHSIIENLGGTISAGNRDDHGAEFTIILPAGA